MVKIIFHIHFNKEIVNIDSSLSGAGIEGVADSLEQLWISYNRVNTEIIKCKKIIFDLFSCIYMYFMSFYLPNPCASSGGGDEIFVKKNCLLVLTDPSFRGGEAGPPGQKQTKKYSR